MFDSHEETLKSQRQRRQNASVSPLWLFAISAGHSFTQSGLKWALYAFFFLAFPAHGDPLRLDAIAVFCPLIGIGKYEMMARKRKKSRCSNDGDFRLRGRRFWRDENDEDSVLIGSYKSRNRHCNRPFPPTFAICRNCQKPRYWVGFVDVLSVNAGERRSPSERSNPAFRVCIN